MRWIHRCICLVLGSLLGCSSDDPTEPVAEYGPPPVKLMIGGTVTQHGTGQPVPDIEVRLAGVDTVQTGIQGDWIITSYTADPTAAAQQVLTFTDVDGPANLGDFFDSFHNLSPDNIVDGVYLESGIDVTVTDDPVAEYGPPCAKRASGESADSE